MPPAALAMRNLWYGTRSAPASGPARMRSSAMNRPKNTAHTPHLANVRSARARCGGPRCFGNRRPRRSSSGRPPRRPIVYPIESPMMAPRAAAEATYQGLIAPVAAMSEAATSVSSPGSGMPMLSRPMMRHTTPPTASGGRVWSQSSIHPMVGRHLQGADRTHTDPPRRAVDQDATNQTSALVAGLVDEIGDRRGDRIRTLERQHVAAAVEHLQPGVGQGRHDGL